MSPVAASERLARLLALVPWVASQDGPTVEAVCQRFSVSEEELLADLQLLFMCGIYPFTPDALIDVDVQGGRVWVRYADWFRRPLRLTAPEGLALLAAASAVAALPGSDADGTLASAMGKLESVLGAGDGTADAAWAGGAASDLLEVDLGPASPGTLDLLRDAAGRGKKVSIDYYSFGRDGRAVRLVHPWSVFNSGGQWYLRAWCEEASGERLFRVDRIAEASSSDQDFPQDEVHDRRRTTLFEGSPDDPLVVLDLSPEARWVSERYPHESLEERPDGVWRVTLRVGNRAWLERLLLRLGPSAILVEGDSDVRPVAARRVLARYAAEEQDR